MVLFSSKERFGHELQSCLLLNAEYWQHSLFNLAYKDGLVINMNSNFDFLNHSYFAAVSMSTYEYF